MVARVKSRSSSRAAAEPRPARKRLGVEERRAQLVELGIDAFSNRPYDEVSIDDVAATAEISKGLLYHYFPTKREFYVATIRAIAERLLDATDFETTGNPLERLRLGLHAYFQFVAKHGPAYGSLLRGGVGVDSEAANVIESTRTVFVERLLSSIDFRDVSALVRTAMRGWIGFVEATSLEWIDRRDLGEHELVMLWSSTLLHLIGPHLREV